MSYYVNYLDEKFGVSQEVLSNECESIFDNISSIEGYRTRIADSNKTEIIVCPIISIFVAIMLVVANIFLFKQGENFIVNMIFIPLDIILLGAGFICLIITKKDKTHLDDFYIEKKGFELTTYIKNKNKIFVYSTTLFREKIERIIMYKNGKKKVLKPLYGTKEIFASNYVDSIHNIAKFFTEYKKAEYRKEIQAENENKIITFDSKELEVKNNRLNKMILSVSVEASSSGPATSREHYFWNINLINDCSKPLHFKNLNIEKDTLA